MNAPLFSLQCSRLPLLLRSHGPWHTRQNAQFPKHNKLTFLSVTYIPKRNMTFLNVTDTYVPTYTYGENTYSILFELNNLPVRV